MATANRRSPESTTSKLLRLLALITATAIGSVLLVNALSVFTDSRSAIWRYRSTPTEPRIFVNGWLRRSPEKLNLPPVCIVNHETYGKCGKNSCWRYYQGMLTTQATLDVNWSSRPLATKELDLGSSFQIEPNPPPSMVVDAERRAIWKERAQNAHLGFADVDLPNHRVVEKCLSEDEVVYLEGCLVSNGRGGQMLTSCGAPAPGSYYGIVRGMSSQPAIDDAADNVAMRVGGAFLIFFIGAAALLRTKGLLVDALSKRSTLPPKKMGVWWLLLIFPPLMGFADILFHSQPATGTWAAGKGGIILSLSAVIVWVLFARALLLRRRTVLSALSPVLSIDRSPLASASGTTELQVRAQKHDENGISPILGGDLVAFAEARIVETFKNGKNTSRLDQGVIRPQNDLRVTDESGEGVLHLAANAVLDVEVRKASFNDVPPRVLQAGKTLTRHPNHICYEVEERVIHDGEQLYVFGDVSDVALQADERGGYRAVRGSPTLGGGATPPVLVFSGDESGLVDALKGEARAASRLAIFAAGMCSVLTAVTAYLISL